MKLSKKQRKFIQKMSKKYVEIRKSVSKQCRKLVNSVFSRTIKAVESVKESARAQAFYAGQFIKSAAFQTVKLTAKSFVMSVAIIALSLSATDLHQKFLEHSAGDNVVYIRSPEGATLQGSGTGFEMKAPSGRVYTITNAHICGLQKDGVVMVRDNHSNRLVPKRVIEVYTENDLCVVEGFQSYSGLKMDGEAYVGQTVFAIGYPLGEALNISRGRVKEFKEIYLQDESIEDPSQCVGPKHRLVEENMLFFVIQVCLKAHDSVATDMTIFPGNSGSPMLDYFGHVVGVVFASSSRTNWGYAVPFKDLQKLMESY